MLKLNNKGFAFSTILYGLLIMGIMIIILVLSIMQTNRSTNKEFVNEVENELYDFGTNEAVITADTTQESYNDSTGTFETVTKPDGTEEKIYRLHPQKEDGLSQPQNPPSNPASSEKEYYRIQLWNVASGSNRGAFVSTVVGLSPDDILHFTLPKVGDTKQTYAYVQWGCEGNSWCQHGFSTSASSASFHYYFDTDNRVREIRNECGYFDNVDGEFFEYGADEYSKYSKCLYFDRSNTGDAKATIERLRNVNNAKDIPTLRFNPNDSNNGEGVYYIKNVRDPNSTSSDQLYSSTVLTCNENKEVYLDYFEGTSNQKWEFTLIENDNGKKYYKITNQGCGTSLRIAEGNDPTTSGIKVDTGDFVDTYVNNQLTAGLKEWQKWYMDPTEDSRGSIAKTINLNYYMYTGYYKDKGEGATLLSVGKDSSNNEQIQVKIKENNADSYKQMFRIYRADYQ